MPRFTYVALDSRGQESTGLVEASSDERSDRPTAAGRLFPDQRLRRRHGRRRGWETLHDAPPRPSARRRGSRSAKCKEHRSFPAQETVKPKVADDFHPAARDADRFRPALAARPQLFWRKQERDPVLKSTINKLADSVQSGSTFSDGLAQHPRIFNDLYVNMVKAGEVGGVLEVVLTRLAEFQEKAAKIKNKVKAAMVYPVIVMTLAIAIMAFLLVFIVPKFEQIFHDMLGDKPLPDRSRSS